jgi:hypothetical protein
MRRWILIGILTIGATGTSNAAKPAWQTGRMLRTWGDGPF